jgi:3'-phosphoadenosine 5'-phosphosulfate sulfotransferase (PAPS reductase)/FAD synthetase
VSGEGESNPYRITGPALISFSGGRTSAYMLRMILDAHGGALPDDVHVCFANTGKEREETLRFVHECATRWGVRVRWLERGPDGEAVEVGYNSASRSGEPFNALLRSKGYLPNAVTRFCTIELKIRVMTDHAKALGWARWTNVVGLRADEPGRVAKAEKRNAAGKERFVSLMPLAAAGVSNRDVRAFWAAQDFDLGLLPFEGNCDACFLKGRPKLFEVERERPGTLTWWAEAEAEAEVTALTGKSSGARFVTEWSYAELQGAVRRQPDLFAGAFDADPDNDAECGLWCAGEVA